MVLSFPAPAAAAIERLRKAGFEAYAVGGCVRDSFLQKQPADWDIATSALPEEIKAVFRGEKTVETGIAHGTVTLFLDKMPLEITTYRVDGSYSDHRRPDFVSFTPLLREDLKRRDFTVNAMAAAPDGTVVDLFGGQADLKNGVIRAVGNAVTRFEEDALRILRGIRFASVLDFSVEKSTAEAMLQCKELLKNVSAERIFSELKKLLCGAGAKRILLEFSPVLGVVLPEILPMVGFDQRSPYHCYDVYTHTVTAVAAVPPTPVLRLAMLLHDIGKPATFTVDETGRGHFYSHPKVSAAMAAELLLRLKCDRDTLTRVCTLIRYHDAPVEETKASVRRWLNRLGEEGFWMLMQIKIGDNAGKAAAFSPRTDGYKRILSLSREVLEERSCFSLGDLKISGNDLIALGMNGKQIGETLRFLLEEVMEERCENQKEPLLALAKTRLR